MQKRNLLSISDILEFVFRMPNATWKDWTISNAVKDGYKASGWVYRAISIIAQNAAQAPMVVYNANNEIEWEHPLTKLFAKPNPRFTHNLMTQLLISWLNLGGMAYIYKNKVGNTTKELWPISPDRISINQMSADGMTTSYVEVIQAGAKPSGLEFNQETIIPLLLPDPANPFEGVGPLQVAARAVDTDTEQTNWNKAAMQNRGVLDGVFLFDKDINDENTFNLILKKVKERFGGSSKAREPGVIGSGAKYQQLSLSPVEMDFLKSRKFNREEIFIIFGVPPQLAGVTDAMTYNVYESSLRILWESTIAPLLETIADAFNNAFEDELGPGYYIKHDYSNIKALKQAEEIKAKTAAIYFNMGVPVKLLNEKFELGLSKYDGWDVSRFNNPASITDTTVATRSSEELRLEWEEWEERKLAQNQKQMANLRDKLAEGVVADKFKEMLDEQQAVIFAALDAGQDPEFALNEIRSKWEEEMGKMFLYVADHFNNPLVKVVKRGRN